MADRTVKPGSQGERGDSASVRTAGERSVKRSRTARSRRSASAPARQGRPRTGTSASARVIAPLALVIGLLAVFIVISASGDEDKTSGSAGQSSSRSESEASSNGSDSGSGSQDSDNQNSDDQGGSADSTGATGPTKATYRVKSGDSFAAIAEETGVDVDVLSELNPEVDPRALQPGQKLKLK
ncbi:MAG: LysM domain-containing protein [Solirubrobacterales bacterium]